MTTMLLALLCALGLLGAARATAPLVHVEEGALKGAWVAAPGGGSYAAFKGVPYARPPVGKYRFKEPTAAKKWPGVWNASEYGSICLQPGPDNQITGSEDCLFLNIFTPKIPTTDPPSLLEVYVYIHGGAFINGAGSFHDPMYLMNSNIVVVTLNYRLGILGFLSTEDDVVPGNNGLKDQAFALRWIQRNIAAFGGDPAKVTIAGCSAGGASVHFHYFSPLSQGLFQRGISLSGTAVSNWAISHGNKMKANKLGDLMGCSTASSSDLIDCLRYRPAENIIKQMKIFQAWHVNPCVIFGPTVEVAGCSPFINKHPADIILEGGVQDLPWISSVTTEEGLYPIAFYAQNEKLLQELDENFQDIAPHLLLYNFTVATNDHNAVSQRIREFYFGNKSLSKETIQQLIKMEGDRIFYADIERAARMMASVNSAPVYFYVFAYRGANSLSDFLTGIKENLGVSHGDDDAYILKTYYLNTQTTEEDKKMSAVMISMCVNFAKTGDPTPTGAGVEWQPVRRNHKSLNYLQINSFTDLEMRSSEDLGNRHFWDALPLQEEQIAAYKTLLLKHKEEL